MFNYFHSFLHPRNSLPREEVKNCKKTCTFFKFPLKFSPPQNSSSVSHTHIQLQKKEENLQPLSYKTIVYIHSDILKVTARQLNPLQPCTENRPWPVERTSTLSSLRCALCASFSLVFTSGYWFCRNSSSSASSCSSVKMVRWRLVRLCTWAELGSSWRASPDLQGSGSAAGGHPYWQAAGGDTWVQLSKQTGKKKYI